MARVSSEQIKPLVAIRTLVYNHAPYLHDYFRGILMQKTTFPFVAIVHDDASTDGSTDIIREYAEKYPNIIKPIFETENQYSKHDGSLKRIMNSACAGIKYLALCEGDDYWTDPYKLQKQIDWLEQHSEYTMVCTDAAVLSTEGELSEADFEKIGWPRYHESKDVRAEDAISLGGWFIHTATMVYRNGLTADYPPACVRCYTGDHTLQMYAALKGKIRYIHEKTAAYRWRWPGSWTGRVSAGDFNPGIIEKWKGKMEMFESLDDYSDGRYRAVFRRTEANYAIQYLAQAKKMAPQALKALGCYLRYEYLAPYMPKPSPDLASRVSFFLKRLCFYPYYPFTRSQYLAAPWLRPFYRVDYSKVSLRIGRFGLITIYSGGGGLRLFGIKIW